MTQHIDITAVMSTYNRCDSLPTAMESVLNQETGGVSYELIVVDNNSNDATRQVVESFISRGHTNLRYVFEPKQGLSHGRNAGIENARGAIVAFVDDDVRAERDWIANIKRAFDTYADVECVGGKILPNWKTEPPAWLNSDHWGPLALQDYGDEPQYADEETPLCLAGANVAFRRELFQHALFSPEFPRAQDMEFLLRFWHAGRRAMYVPDVVVFADVQDERLTKRYHRKWHATNGTFNSLMRLGEFVSANGQILNRLPEAVKLFDAPGFLYRELARECAQWMAATVRRRESLSFKHEVRVRYLIRYISKRYEHEFASRNSSHVMEVGRFIKAILHKKIHNLFAR
jgi:glycosyltransferase involved in cell wall biosynthesis